MKSLLRIDTSTRGIDSHSRGLADIFVSKWTSKNADARVVIRDLTTSDIPHLDQSCIEAMFTPQEDRTTLMSETLALSDKFIAELKSADTLLLSLPMFNFSLPSVLKAYIDHITRVGETFSMDETGFTGLITGKKLIIVAAYGADFSQMKSMDFVEPYLKSIFGFLGFEDISYFALEGTSQLGKEELSNKVDGIAMKIQECIPA